MFYKTGIDITNDKQMFNFLKEHFEYPILLTSSWTRAYSIANNVKVYNLKLSGDCWTALSLLESDNFDTIRWMLADWEREHPGYEVFFNGRSNGYLVLKEQHLNEHVLPYEIVNFDTYEDYKEFCREEYGSVKATRDDLRFYTQLVRDFDKKWKNYAWNSIFNTDFIGFKSDDYYIAMDTLINLSQTLCLIFHHKSINNFI